MIYSYYDYLENHYDSYYEYTYWPQYYGVITISNQSYICSNTNSTPWNYTMTNSPTNSKVINGTLCQIFNNTYPPYVYKHPHNTDYITPPLFALTLICAALAILITIIFCRKLYSVCQSKKERQQKIVVMLITSISMISHLCVAILDPTMYFFWWINYSRQNAIQSEIAWELCWLITKLSLYSVYIYRYYKIFIGANYASKLETFIIFGAFVGVMLVQTILFIIYIWYYVDYLSSWENPSRRTYLNMAWAFLFIDFFLVFIISFSLNRTVLKVVIKSQKFIPTDNETDVGPQTVEQKRKLSLRKNDLMNAATKIALICMISMLSSFCVQFVWLIQEETNNALLYWISYMLWCSDNVVNMFCIYLLLCVAKTHYEMLCKQICKLHQCCLFCMVKVIYIQIKRKYSQTDQKSTAVHENGNIDITSANVASDDQNSAVIAHIYDKQETEGAHEKSKTNTKKSVASLMLKLSNKLSDIKSDSKSENNNILLTLMDNPSLKNFNSVDVIGMNNQHKIHLRPIKSQPCQREVQNNSNETDDIITPKTA
eukprot:404471_1